MPYNHFGSAPFFLIYDTTTHALEVINNGDLAHEHGMCQPLKALGGHAIDTLFVAGIGAGALNKLNHMGITTYQAATTNFSHKKELPSSGKLLFSTC